MRTSTPDEPPRAPSPEQPYPLSVPFLTHHPSPSALFFLTPCTYAFPHESEPRTGAGLDCLSTRAANDAVLYSNPLLDIPISNIAIPVEDLGDRNALSFLPPGNTGISTDGTSAPDLISFDAAYNVFPSFGDGFHEPCNWGPNMNHFDFASLNGPYSPMQQHTDVHAAQSSIAVPQIDVGLPSYSHGNELPASVASDSSINHLGSLQGTPGLVDTNTQNRISCSQPGCKSTFGRPQEFRRHMKTKHNSERSNEYRCVRPDCDYLTARLDKLREHMQRMHNLDLQRHQ